MDKTVQYIMMCEKAENLQKNFKESLISGTYLRWYNTDEHSYRESILTDNEVKEIQEKEHMVILFSQEQLQYLFASSFPSIDILERMVFDWRWEKDYWTIFESFEQLWLAFVMKERHHMVWNITSETWIHLKR
jgi:hypothetical protein